MNEVYPPVRATNEQIIDIVRRSLGHIDRRLMEHGERVAYIADHIDAVDEALDVDRETLLVLCLLHDIGAYKTEEIDEMVRFETVSVTSHALYGYLFLRYATVLGDWAEAVLYHHTDHDMLITLDTPCKTYAGLIFLADRIDILLAADGAPDWDALRRLSGTAFSPVLVERFFAAEARFDVSGHIRDGSYEHSVLSRLRAVSLSADEIMSYLKMLVYSIDFRSPFTVTHTANTAAISTMLAELFELDEQTRQAVALGAFLHDIGKIAIPYAILENPGRLTDEQMAVMRTHVAFSEEILCGIVSDEVCQIAVRHHEKLNGTGYCRGLTAAELTLPQRIVAVADILSALLNRRSYKEAFSTEMSVSILKRMRDAGELCPTVCAMAIDNLDAILQRTNLADDPVVELYETIQRQYDELYAQYMQQGYFGKKRPSIF